MNKNNRKRRSHRSINGRSGQEISANSQLRRRHNVGDDQTPLLDSPAPEIEDVALCLMMLSQDSWDAPFAGEMVPPATRRRSRFQCEACKKIFRSFQALGGHRARRKKSRCGCNKYHEIIFDEFDGGGVGETKVYECPFCFRIFGSGQALGGHKRAHLNASPTTSPMCSAFVVGKNECLIDLNLPAVMECDDMELSTVSDAEFVAK